MRANVIVNRPLEDDSPLADELVGFLEGLDSDLALGETIELLLLLQQSAEPADRHTTKYSEFSKEDSIAFEREPATKVSVSTQIRLRRLNNHQTLRLAS